MEDIDDIVRLLGDRRVAEMMSGVPWPYERKHAEEWLPDAIAAHEQDKGEAFVIALRETGELMGVIGLHPDDAGPWAWFGYWLGVPYWGRGYMTEALEEILRFGFEERGFRRLEACHFIDNPASGRVMLKAGLTQEGVQKLRVMRAGELYDRAIYGIIDEEWRAARKSPQETNETAES